MPPPYDWAWRELEGTAASLGLGMPILIGVSIEEAVEAMHSFAEAVEKGELPLK
jgi:hypothetical protein